MVSNLAKATVQEWQSQGLNPTFDDIILINSLGVKLENNAETYNFSAVPRVAFLGDNCLWEPTVAKKIWMDCASKMIADNYLSHLTFTIFALNCPERELPTLENVKELNECMRSCQEEIVNHYTETQLLAAIKYVLKGCDPHDDTLEEDDNFKQAEEEVHKLPNEIQSQAKQLLIEALSYGIDDDVKYEVTCPQLERMVTVAAMHSGSDILKSEHAQRTGAFYAAAGKIKTRLMKEKKDLESRNGKE